MPDEPQNPQTQWGFYSPAGQFRRVQKQPLILSGQAPPSRVLRPDGVEVAVFEIEEGVEHG